MSSDWLSEADRELLRRVDDALADAERRSHGSVACRLGCTECCVGPFEITALDALRLRRGLSELEGEEPRLALEVSARAREQWRTFAGSFPGDRASGILADDTLEQEAFLAARAEVPCPALEPGSGACVLYRHRPISCRTFGLPISCGAETLPPCRLNFVGAPAELVDACAVDPDPEDLEGAILARLERAGLFGNTIVAAALALPQATPDPSEPCGRFAPPGPAPPPRTS